MPIPYATSLSDSYYVSARSFPLPTTLFGTVTLCLLRRKSSDEHQPVDPWCAIILARTITVIVDASVRVRSVYTAAMYCTAPEFAEGKTTSLCSCIPTSRNFCLRRDTAVRFCTHATRENPGRAGETIARC